jgi:hypothetical protein
MWDNRLAIQVAILSVTAMPVVSSCASNNGHFVVNLGIVDSTRGAIGAPTASLSGYHGADAETRLDTFVRGYCDSPFRVVDRSGGGDLHSVTFECEGSR